MRIRLHTDSNIKIVRYAGSGVSTQAWYARALSCLDGTTQREFNTAETILFHIYAIDLIV